jgi:hypothetical protein
MSLRNLYSIALAFAVGALGCGSSSSATTDDSANFTSAPTPAPTLAYDFHVDGQLVAGIAFQPVTVTGTLHLKAPIATDQQIEIDWIHYSIEVTATDLLQAFTLTSLDPSAASPDWTDSAPGFVTRDAKDTSFFVESKTLIPLDAKPSVFSAALTDGVPAQAIVKLFPVCNADLTSCVAGNVSGITFDPFAPLLPQLRLVTTAPFVISPAKGT